MIALYREYHDWSAVLKLSRLAAGKKGRVSHSGCLSETTEQTSGYASSYEETLANHPRGLCGSLTLCNICSCCDRLFLRLALSLQRRNGGGAGGQLIISEAPDLGQGDIGDLYHLLRGVSGCGVTSGGVGVGLVGVGLVCAGLRMWVTLMRSSMARELIDTIGLKIE